MDPTQLVLYLAELLEEKQAHDIVIVDVEDLVGYTSYFLIASGRSDRQVKALVDHVKRQSRTDAVTRPIGIEGANTGRWALVDFGDVVVHIFREDERDYYDLEGLWQDAPRLDRPEKKADPVPVATDSR
jgi:ribosome-associated protein